jgi:hypothetical protein
MTFLTKLATILLKAGSVITGFSPLVPSQMSGTLDKIAEIIVIAETIGQTLQLKGPDKLKMAAPLIANIILKSELLIDKKIRNQDLFNESIEQLTSGFVGVLNSLDENSVHEKSVNT